MDKQTLTNYLALGTNLVSEPHFEKILTAIEKNLGSVDSDIREGSLDLLWDLIEADALDGETCCALGSRMSAHLSHGLTDNDDHNEPVFLRTFSALILGVIISHDERQHRLSGNFFLPRKRYNQWAEAAFHYANTERDFRSYIPIKGWAHAIAHSADLLRDCSFHRYSNAKIQTGTLEHITFRLTQSGHDVFLHNEGHRLTRIVIVTLYRQTLALDVYQAWLDTLVKDVLACLQSEPDMIQRAVLKHNAMAFLEALFFTLTFGMKNIKDIPEYDTLPPLADDVKLFVQDALKQIDAGLNYHQ
ncbi:DUF2785 domain-containing protein [Fusibacter paucivorans]|uniref:DUF2785 domain-containing protein n=1 Tax=Fusibacter paucivorans TaxID=76009 RepID=A0ABS5PSC3_9FIRM|nr:DUF2785 domain-containing protein [Fusibacter paucivorans]MBS7528068.1 DUF2785 domain-containing protein [Fusibacter paucivorans]